ncbi:MAG: hypothetical protein ABEJ58_08270 [Halodesulfurarchaeum sp.]
MLARDQLRGDGGTVGPEIESISELTLWKRNLRREIARRRGVQKSRVHVETERQDGEIVFHAIVDS